MKLKAIRDDAMDLLFSIFCFVINWVIFSYVIIAFWTLLGWLLVLTKAGISSLI